MKSGCRDKGEGHTPCPHPTLTGFSDVTSGTGEAHPSPVLFGELFGAKLSAPKVRQGLVSRAHLIEKAQGSRCRVVGVTEPAGYGKTTLLAEWAEDEERSVAFVSLIASTTIRRG
jgi:LuxR family maltose regulon positive regulatory protein